MFSRGQRPNHVIQWLYDDQWEPMFSPFLVKGIRTTLKVTNRKEYDKQGSNKNQEYQKEHR